MNIVAFFAHPDDETLLAGGTFALLSRQGASLTYLSATRGEGGELGDPPLCDRSEAGVVRARELACAVEALGGGELHFMDYIDPLVGPGDRLFPFTDDAEGLADLLRWWLIARGADVLISHGSNGEYGHPAHRLCHRAARAALEGMNGSRPLFYTVQAAFPGSPKPTLLNKDDPAHLVLDVSPVQAQKIQAALCHRTQNDLFKRRTSEELGRPVTIPEVIALRESLRRVWPPVDASLDDPLAALLRAAGCVLTE